VLCQALEVSESGYYAWKQREPSQHCREDAHLSAAIQQLFLDLRSPFNVTGRFLSKLALHQYTIFGMVSHFSQGIRGFGLRSSRYLGEAKTHLQHVLTAGAVNLVRFAAWMAGVPHAKTRTSRFAALKIPDVRMAI
jgi:transposase